MNGLQDSHEGGKPQLLSAEKSVCVGPPFTALDVVDIAQDNKHPSGLFLLAMGFGR